jgi:hypothetical protein
MSFLSDAIRLPPSRRDLIIGAAILIAFLVGVFVWYGPKYDQPSAVPTAPRKVPIRVFGKEGSLSVVCECPPYLIEERSRDLRFRVSVSLNSVQGPNPSPPPAQTSETSKSTGIDKLDIGVNAGGTGANFPPDPNYYLAVDSDLTPSSPVESTISITLTPLKSTSSSEIVLTLQHYKDQGGAVVESLGHVDFSVPVRSSFVNLLAPIFYSLLVFLSAVVALYLLDRKYRLLQEQEKEKLERARENVRSNPTQAAPAWDLASVNLQSYFSRNLIQVRQVFYLSVGVMLAGFACVLYGVYIQISLGQPNPDHVIPPTKVAAVSGLITQFIGATFMVIYRSTMAQANEFVTVLDRINTVSIAMKVLDQIPDEAPLKNPTRQTLITLLLSSSSKLPMNRAEKTDISEQRPDIRKSGSIAPEN